MSACQGVCVCVFVCVCVRVCVCVCALVSLDSKSIYTSPVLRPQIGHTSTTCFSILQALLLYINCVVF